MPDFEAVAAAANMSRHHFHRVFRAAVGLTPGAYAKAVRHRRAIQGLAAGKGVTEAIYEAGYGASSRFYEAVGGKLGIRPSAFLKGGAGAAIVFALRECSLGTVIVAATAKGVCAVELGGDGDTLRRNLKASFPDADLIEGGGPFAEIVAQVVTVVEDPRRKLDLPLHVLGTAFQHKVWQALLAIEPGRLKTYAEMATITGQPSAIRAVANAIASNKIAVAIPCHRVVRTGGALSGYRWGVERKAALLRKEAEIDLASTPSFGRARDGGA